VAEITKKGALDSQVIKVYQLLAHGPWFSPGIPASSTTKTGRHDIAEILQKVALESTWICLLNRSTDQWPEGSKGYDNIIQ
jgi:hypothetical protein